MTTIQKPTMAPASRVTSPATVVETRGLQKSYRKGTVEVPVLRGVDLQIEDGKVTSIIGQSGSGKSTLLHLLATLDAPDAGEIYYREQRIDDLSSAARERLRNSQFGMIFQFYHLLPELSALENVLLPNMISLSTLTYWRQRAAFKKLAADLLDRVGLSHRSKHRPSEMSGGEMQRVAIARALMSRPRILFADEPTGNLDSETGHEIMDLLTELNDRDGLTIVMVTHDDSIARQADRTVRLTAGRIVDQRLNNERNVA